MAFKRALWHSGLTYQQTCRTCRTAVRYTDHSLDFRPWYADGFVYCPKCQTPLRHNEAYAINEDGTPYFQTAPQAAGGSVAYCSKCGRQYTPETDHFCPSCGNKLD